MQQFLIRQLIFVKRGTTYSIGIQLYSHNNFSFVGVFIELIEVVYIYNWPTKLKLLWECNWIPIQFVVPLFTRINCLIGNCCTEKKNHHNFKAISSQIEFGTYGHSTSSNLIIQVMSDDGIIWPFPRFWGLGSNEQSASFWQQSIGKVKVFLWCDVFEGRTEMYKKIKLKWPWRCVDVCMPTPHRSNNTGGRPNFDHCTVGAKI